MNKINTHIKNVSLLLFVLVVSTTNLDSQNNVISAGSGHSLFACSTSSSPKAWGNNSGGQLGDGTTTHRSIPIFVSALTGVTSVSGGGGHSLFLKNDGTVWACGGNLSGQLGDGTTTQRTTPVEITTLNNIIAISAGDSHSLFLKNDGTVWACGDNNYLQLGDGTNNAKIIPFQISGLSNIIAISAGWQHSLFLKNDGTVWACGSNNAGELGDGSQNAALTPKQITSLVGITKISAGAYRSLFLKNDGTVLSCGSNSFGELGDGTTQVNRLSPVQVNSLSGIISIAQGSSASHSIFLKSDGTVWACGNNSSGQLGDGTTTNRGTVVQVTAVSGIVEISGNGTHTMFLKNDGTVWAVGENNAGQLGDGTTTNRLTAVQSSAICSVNTAIGSIENSNMPVLYPSPTTGIFNIALGKYSDYKIQIYDPYGKCIFHSNFTGPSQQQVDFSDKAKGIYFVKVTTDEIQLTKKVVIQ